MLSGEIKAELIKVLSELVTAHQVREGVVREREEGESCAFSCGRGRAACEMRATGQAAPRFQPVPDLADGNVAAKPQERRKLVTEADVDAFMSTNKRSMDDLFG